MLERFNRYIQIHERNFILTNQAQALLYKLQITLQNNPDNYGKVRRTYLKARNRYNRRFATQLDAQ